MSRDREKRNQEKVLAEAKLIEVKAEYAQVTLVILSCRAQENYASVQQLEMSAQARANSAFDAFRADCQREAKHLITTSIAYHMGVAQQEEAEALNLRDE